MATSWEDKFHATDSALATLQDAIALYLEWSQGEKYLDADELDKLRAALEEARSFVSEVG